MNRLSTLYKNAYSGLAPSTWWLSLVMLINRCGTMVLPFMTLYLTESKHISISKAGFVVALFGLGAICGAFIGGKLTDKFSFYFIQMTALIGGGIMFIILGQIKTYEWICVFTFILSLINESFRPANAAAVAHYSKEENRTRSFALNRLSINLGWAFGGALGGFIASTNYHLLFWIDGMTNFVAALLLWLFLAPSKNEATIKKISHDSVEDITPPYRDKYYMVFIILTVLYAYCFFQWFTTIPIFFKRHLHMSEFYIGMNMAMNGILIGLFEMVIIHNLEGRRNYLHFVTIGAVLFGLSFFIFNMLPWVMLLAFISTIICTLGEMLSMPFMNSFWISRTAHNNRGQYAALYTIAWATAQVLGPATGAQIADKLGFAALWWLMGSICVISALGYKWLQRKTAMAKR